MAWSIDDFCHNLKVYTPEKIAALRAKRADQPAPGVRAVRLLPAGTAAFAADYGKLVERILFPYRSESGKAGLTDPARVPRRLRRSARRWAAPPAHHPGYLRHSHSSLAIQPRLRTRGHGARADAADGVMIYCHQDKQPRAAKYQVIKALFNQWAGEALSGLGELSPEESFRVSRPGFIFKNENHGA